MKTKFLTKLFAIVVAATSSVVFAQTTAEESKTEQLSSGSTTVSGAIVISDECRPDYPQEARFAEQQGTVKMQFTVSADGQMLNATILRSSGFKSLDAAAYHGLSRCKFVAGLKDGKPVLSKVETDMVWRLTPAPPAPASATEEPIEPGNSREESKVWSWFKVADYDKATSYADAANIQIAGDRATMWTLYDYKTQQKGEGGVLFFSMNPQIEYDCSGKQSRPLYMQFFSGHMGMGKNTFHVKVSETWRRIAPGTTGESMWKIACKNSAPRQ